MVADSGTLNSAVPASDEGLVWADGPLTAAVPASGGGLVWVAPDEFPKFGKSVSLMVFRDPYQKH